MIEAIVAMALIIILLLSLLDREGVRSAERQRAFERERKSLLDRIQHPERVQVAPGPYEPVEPPIDAAELAYVGQEVPEFVSVGSDENHQS